jgi:hypothetical protein
MFYVAAIVGAVVSFLVGCLWYSVLFGKAWKSQMGFSDERVKKIFVPKRIVCAFIFQWFAAACLTGILTNLPLNVWFGALMSAVIVVFNSALLGVFDGKKPATIFINAGYMLVSIAIIAGSVSIFV